MTTRQHTGVSPESVIVSWVLVGFGAFLLGVLVGVML